MRWVPLAILTYLLLLAQTTVGGVLTFRARGIGLVGPDLLAIAAVYVALHVRSCLDAMLAGWLIGLAVDLTTGAATVLGPMPLAYALAAGCICRVREAFFRERIVTQALLAVLFCLIAHGLWLTIQCLFALRAMTWSSYGRLLLQAAALYVYTGVLTPLVGRGLRLVQGWIISAPAAARQGRR